MYEGRALYSFLNTIEGQGRGAIFDAKWDPDGHHFGASDSHGHVLLFGPGSRDKFKKVRSKALFILLHESVVRFA